MVAKIENENCEWLLSSLVMYLDFSPMLFTARSSLQKNKVVVEMIRKGWNRLQELVIGLIQQGIITCKYALIFKMQSESCGKTKVFF